VVRSPLASLTSAGRPAWLQRSIDYQCKPSRFCGLHDALAGARRANNVAQSVKS
jgi:hypothetical protein